MITEAESTPHPIVTLYLDLANIDKTLSKMRNELEKAFEDASDNYDLSNKIKTLLDQTMDDLTRIRQSEQVVKNNPKWETQWSMYKSEELKERQIQTQQSLANAQNSQAMAMWFR